MLLVCVPLSSVAGTIQQVVRYTYAVMRSKALNKVSTAQGGRCEVEKTCITWSVDGLDRDSNQRTEAATPGLA
jgi:hypothetical protein